MAQLVLMQTDQDDNCAALAARLDEIDGDVNGLDGDVKTGNGHLASIDSTTSGWTGSNPLQVQLPAGGSGQAVQVTNWPADQTVGLDTTASGQLDGDSQSEHDDLWVLIGVVVGCALMDVALRKLWP